MMIKFLDLHKERFCGEMDAVAKRVLDCGWYYKAVVRMG